MKTIKIGDKVRVLKTTNGKAILHEGIYLGEDELGSHKVGVTKTSIPGVTIKPGKTYISVFYCSIKRIQLI